MCSLAFAFAKKKLLKNFEKKNKKIAKLLVEVIFHTRTAAAATLTIGFEQPRCATTPAFDRISTFTRSINFNKNTFAYAADQKIN